MRQFIVFDLDDTLIPSTKIYSLALKKVGIKPTGVEYQKARALVKGRLDQSPSAHNRLLYFKAMLENRKRLTPEKALLLQSKYEKALVDLIRNDWKKSKRAALLRKLSKKYHLAIVTNENTRTQLLKLLAIDPKFSLFKAVITSEEIGVEKPNEKVFELLITQLGNPAPENVTLVGDSLRNDIEPAIKLGWRAIWTREFLKPEEKVTGHSLECIDSLQELPYILGI